VYLSGVVLHFSKAGGVELVAFVKLRGSRGFALSSIFMKVFCRELPLLHACHRSRLLHANVPAQHEQQYEND